MSFTMAIAKNEFKQMRQVRIIESIFRCIVLCKFMPWRKNILHEPMLGKGKPTLERETIQYNNGDQLVINPRCHSGKHMEFALQ